MRRAPEVAHDAPEHPILVEQQVRRVERHREEADEEVGHSERCDEVCMQSNR